MKHNLQLNSCVFLYNSYLEKNKDGFARVATNICTKKSMLEDSTDTPADCGQKVALLCEAALLTNIMFCILASFLLWLPKSL